MVAKEVKQFAELAREGAARLLERAVEALDRIPSGDSSVVPEGTVYHLPVIFGLTGAPVKTLAGLKAPLELASSLIGPSPADEPWLPYLGTALDAGVSALISAEALSALSALSLPAQEGYLGFPPDAWVKKQGKRLLDSEEVAFVFALGAPENNFEPIASEFVEKNLTVFSTGDEWRTRGAVSLTYDISGIAYAFGTLARLAMMNGVRPGDSRALLEFCRRRLFGFIALFDDADPVARAIAAGGISFGLATIVREYTPQLLPVYSVPRF